MLGAKRILLPSAQHLVAKVVGITTQSYASGEKGDIMHETHVIMKNIEMRGATAFNSPMHMHPHAIMKLTK